MAAYDTTILIELAFIRLLHMGTLSDATLMWCENNQLMRLFHCF